ncbi:2-oxo acid dehydrogenase subunit E2 [Buchnera aphidicola]|uniref:2-oxo acid dehydrogenase subunit E2 n=1 Tax=Buchnera aphidicola TaxID=9 RepID=UPI0020BDC12C|nr:2-oxo acid dehydrogenase subunit E2 [Buchnera aphidicola]
MHIEVKMPDVGLDEVEVTEILVKLDEEVKIEQGLITVEGDKSSMEIPSPISGIIKKIDVKVGDKVSTGSVIMIFMTNQTNSINQEKESVDTFEIKKSTIKKDIIHATPSVRRLARELNINLSDVLGSGRKNRILKEDLESYTKKFFHDEYKLKVEKIEINHLQRNVGKNLSNNWINIPHVTQFDEVNITTLEEFRQNYNNEECKKNIDYKNVTILVFVIKAVSHALLKFPIFNSSLSKDKKTIILKKYVNIGVAVDVSNGLLVPVLKNVNKKSIVHLSSELILISDKARKNKLDRLDIKDSCFTISNLGSVGGYWFTPIINSPEVAILGVSRAVIKPTWDGKNFIPSLTLPLSLSYDHRVINGVEAARFICFLKKLLSDVRFLIM